MVWSEQIPIGLAVGCLLTASRLTAQTEYPLTADHERHPGVPAGVVTQHSWKSTIFPGTVRDYWVYVPAQYKPEVPAAVMVFQDGGGFVGEQGRWRAPVVFDNLIHKAQMPVTIGVFINPGVLPAPSKDQEARYNRSFEYDGLGDRYARFLLEEILPEVAKNHNLTSDPNLRAIAGFHAGFAGTVQCGTNTIVRRGHPQAPVEVRPPVGVVVLTTTRAERIHHQKWPPVFNARRVILAVANDVIRRCEIPQRREIGHDGGWIRVEGDILAMIGPERITADLH